MLDGKGEEVGRKGAPAPPLCVVLVVVEEEEEEAMEVRVTVEVMGCGEVVGVRVMITVTMAVEGVG